MFKNFNFNFTPFSHRTALNFPLFPSTESNISFTVNSAHNFAFKLTCLYGKPNTLEHATVGHSCMIMVK